MPSVGPTGEAKSDTPCKLIRIENFGVTMPDPINGIYSEQPIRHNDKPCYIRIRGGPDSDPMVMWYAPNPKPGKCGLWMINNKSQFDRPDPTAKAAAKSDCACPADIEQEKWMAYNPATGRFIAHGPDSNLKYLSIQAIFHSEENNVSVRPSKMKVSGRLGYNRAMNGTYVRGKKAHCGKSYYKHTENDFTIRWYETKWVVDWRGLHNDNIGAAVCKEDVPEPWMCTIPWRIYDGKARDKKWKFDQNVTMVPISDSMQQTAGTFE